MRFSNLKVIVGMFLATILSAPAFGTVTPLPGTLNYVEGQAHMGSQELNSKSVGSSNLEVGQSISTDKGRAEILLTPGVFLRLDNDSSAQMISPSLTNTEVQLTHGRAMLEVAEIHKQNVIKIDEDGSTTQVLKDGLYAFDANSGTVQVFDGKADVLDKDKIVALKSGRELNVESDARLKAQKFDKKNNEDDFYNWSSLRSEYESEANVDVARLGPSGVISPGWFWDPWFSAYTFVPGDGIFYSPFGWGFYSPAWIGYYGYYGAPYHYRPGYYPHHRVGGPAIRPAPAIHGQPGFGGFHGGGFHGGGIGRR